MKAPESIAPMAQTRTGRNERVIGVAIQATREMNEPAGVIANWWGALVMERCLNNALRAEAVKINRSGTAHVGLTRGVFLFFVQEIQPALAVIISELRALGMESISVVGVFDRSEDYWRAAHPTQPAFDLNARMNEVMPLGDPGENTVFKPSPEWQRICEIVKSSPYPLPSIRKEPPFTPPPGFLPPENPS